MEKDVEITKIVVRMGRSDKELTLAQAERLYEELAKLFETKKGVVRHEHHYDQWLPFYWHGTSLHYTVPAEVPHNDQYQDHWAVCAQQGTATLHIE